MRTVLIYQHQTGFYGSKDKTSFELQMLCPLLHGRRITGIQRRRLGSGLNGFRYSGNRLLESKRFFLDRLIHSTCFLQTGIQPFPLYALARITSSAAIRRGRGSLERIEVRIIMHLRRFDGTALLKCRNVRHALCIKVYGRYSIEFSKRFFHSR